MNSKIYILLLTLFVGIGTSCENEDGQAFTDFQTGAIPLFTRAEDDPGIINLSNLDGVNLGFSVDIGEAATITESMDVTITYTHNGVNTTEVYQSYSEWPVALELTVDDLIGVFDASIVQRSTLAVGDRFTINANIQTKDGRYLVAAYGPAVLGNYPVRLQYNVTCLSNIPLGTYNAVSTATSTDPCPPTNPLTNFASTVTLTADGSGRYRVSDIFAGVYVNWYGACYGAVAEPAVLTDVCNTLSLSFTEQYGTLTTGSGTYNPTTGVIQYSWANGYGDVGTTTLTPQ